MDNIKISFLDHYIKFTISVDDVLKGDLGIKGKEIVINQLDSSNIHYKDGTVLCGDVFPARCNAGEKPVFFLIKGSEEYRQCDPHLRVTAADYDNLRLACF